MESRPAISSRGRVSARLPGRPGGPEPEINISEQKSHSAAARAYRKWQCLVIAISVRLDVSLNLQDFLADRHFVFKQKSCVNRTTLPC